MLATHLFEHEHDEEEEWKMLTLAKSDFAMKHYL